MQDLGERSLASIRLFEDLEPAERGRLERACQWRRYHLGERVFDHGSTSRDVYFVLTGAVNIVNFSPSGREVAFGQAVAGGSFGELAAIDGKPRSAIVVAREESFLARLDCQVFLDLLDRHAAVNIKLLRRLAQIIRQEDERIMELATLAASRRVFAELIRMAKPDAAVPDLWLVRPMPPLHEVAARVGTSRETVSRALAELYPTGLIRRKDRNLYLMDKAALEEIITHHGG